ncbi:MAG TPA: spore germination protein, partial [Ruminococcaceae bacterium]|nr:spore germination protein [Oscillospiraceae bacterium]
MKTGFDFSSNTKLLDKYLRISESFDMIKRVVVTGGRMSAMYMVDGFVKDAVMEKILEFVMSADVDKTQKLKTAEDYAREFIPYVEVSFTDEIDEISTAILSGTIAYIIDGYQKVILIDAR